MVKFESLEPLADPAHPISFLLDWELTLKCNLDCTYCGTGLYAGHDNSTQHPPLDECLRTLDFMYEYADLYLTYKTPSLRKVVLNVYGGESLHHPNIVTLLEAAHERHEKYNWPLTISTTTNAIVTPAKLSQVLPFIDHWTVSYHTECSDKQKQQFKDNLLAIKDAGKSLKCVVLMHSDPALFADAEQMIAWLKSNNIEITPRALDHPAEWDQFNYNPQQIKWFNRLHNNDLVPVEEATDLSDVGRACCGGRSMCQNGNYKDRVGFVSNKFTGWSCSVNWFFLYVKQVNGELYTNKDCMMNFDGSVGPIGNLSDCNAVLTKLKYQLETGTLPVIECAKPSCWCGLCAPKARTRSMYDSMIAKYQKGYKPEEQL